MTLGPETVNTSEEDECSSEAEKKAKEWDEFVANTYSDVWEVEASLEMDPKRTPDYPDPFECKSEEEETPIEDEYSPEAEKNVKECEEFVANTYIDMWEVEVSPEMNPPQGTPDYPDSFDGKLEEEETPMENEYSPAKELEEFVARMRRPIRKIVKVTVLGLLAVTVLLVAVEPMLPDLPDGEV